MNVDEVSTNDGQESEIRNQKSGNVTQHHSNSTLLPERENGRKNGKYGEYGFH